MNRKILITGATSGLGKAFYDCLQGKQDHFLITGRNAAVLERMRKTDTETEICDLTKDEDRIRLFCRIRQWKPDIAIICAGAGAIGPFCSLDPDRLRNLESVNILAYTEIMQTLCDCMGNGGSILMVSSVGALLPGGPFQAVYYAQKAYQLSLATALNMEQNAVRISCMCPGPLDTPFHARAGGHALCRAMAPETCAEKALKSFFRHRRLIIPGISNKMIYVCAKIMPRSWILRVTAHQIRKKMKG